MVLRFRDLVAPTIREHQALIEAKGYVWWAWWNKPDEKLPRNTFAAFQPTARERGSLNIFLLDSGTERLYVAVLTEIRYSDTETPISCPEPDASPSYYQNRLYKAWFKFSSIEEATIGVLRNYSYDDVTEFLDDPAADRFQDKRVFSAHEMLNRQHRTIYFLQPYEEHHKDYELSVGQISGGDDRIPSGGSPVRLSQAAREAVARAVVFADRRSERQGYADATMLLLGALA